MNCKLLIEIRQRDSGRWSVYAVVGGRSFRIRTCRSEAEADRQAMRSAEKLKNLILDGSVARLADPNWYTTGIGVKGIRRRGATGGLGGALR